LSAIFRGRGSPLLWFNDNLQLAWGGLSDETGRPPGPPDPAPDHETWSCKAQSGMAASHHGTLLVTHASDEGGHVFLGTTERSVCGVMHGQSGAASRKLCQFRFHGRGALPGADVRPPGVPRNLRPALWQAALQWWGEQTHDFSGSRDPARVVAWGTGARTLIWECIGPKQTSGPLARRSLGPGNRPPFLLCGQKKYWLDQRTFYAPHFVAATVPHRRSPGFLFGHPPGRDP